MRIPMTVIIVGPFPVIPAVTFSTEGVRCPLCGMPGVLGKRCPRCKKKISSGTSSRFICNQGPTRGHFIHRRY